MIRRITSLAFGIAIVAMATTAFAQDEGAEGGGDMGDTAAEGGDAAGGDAAPAGDEAAPADSGGEAAAADASVSTDSGGGDKKMAVGADVAFMLPLGDLGDATGPQIGALLKFQYLATPNIGITARAGYLYGLSKTQSSALGDIKTSLSVIPIWAGARYYLGEGEGLHFGAELGLNMLSAKVEVGGASNSDSETKFGFNVPVGYKLGDLDIAAQFTVLDTGHFGESEEVGITVGYDFAKF